MANSEPIGRVGPYQLSDRLGGGGMATVFEAETSDGGGRVALKILTGESAISRRRRGRFHREVHALARLSHPCVARVVDFGEIAREDEVPEEIVVPDRAPWLAMERVEGGRLPLDPKNWNWEKLQAAVVQTLDGLAHAHADGILHRDLKPANVMVREGDEELSIKLVDFGLARILEAEEKGGYVTATHDRVAGTPNYMAPEQIAGERRDQGPWTDLYAVGCMVWKIVDGEAPFDADAAVDVLRKHLYEEPAEFEPRFPVPEGLEDWLRALLRRSPKERFRRAADALWSFLRFDAPEPGRGEELQTDDAEISVNRDGAGEETIRESVTPTVPLERMDEPLGEEAPEADSSGGLEVEFQRPPIPPTWERLDSDGESERPVVGSGLLGLRRVPFVDRKSARNKLWSGLRHCAQTVRPIPMLISGPEGIGKSRIASWCCRRGHELGAAITLRAVHSPGLSGARDGLGAMFARHFRCLGLDEREVRETLEESSVELGFEGPGAAHDRAAFATVMATSSGEGPGRSSRGSQRPEVRHRLMVRVLESLARERPVLLWLDDVQWNAEAIRFVEVLSEYSVDRELPVCCLMTFDETVVGDDSSALEVLRDLEDSTNVQHVELDALDDEDVRDLAVSSLGLEGRAREVLVERSEGNPLYAVELARHWVETDALVETSEGYTVREEELESVSEGLRQIWMERLDRALEAFEPELREASEDSLALAALLGRNVAVREWRAAREQLDIEAPNLEELANRLARHGILESDSGGWSFTHKVAGDIVRAEYADDRDVSRLHRACASGLESCYEGETWTHLRRIAEHWIGAGELVRGADALDRFASRAGRVDSLEEANKVTERHARVVEQLEGEAAERHRLRNRHTTLWLDAAREGVALSREELEEMAERAERRGWSFELGTVLNTRSLAAIRVNEPETAGELASRAMDVIDPDRAPTVWAFACRSLSNAHRNRGERTRAKELLERAIEKFEEVGAEGARLASMANLVYLETAEGRTERAREILREARARAREIGAREPAAQLANMAGDVARREDRLEEALDEYEKARALRREAGRGAFRTPDFNVAVTHLQRGDFEEGGRIFRELEEAPESTKFAWLPVVPLGLAASAAADGRLSEARSHFETARAALAESELAFFDVVRVAEAFAAAAARQNETELARKGFELAAERAEAAGLDDREERLRRTLEQFDGA